MGVIARRSIVSIIVVALMFTINPFVPDFMGGTGTVEAAPAKYTLTGDQAKDVVGLAKSCQGMTLAQTKKRLGSYGKTLYQPKYDYHWCAWFVSNCAAVSGVPAETFYRHCTSGPNAGFHSWAVKKGLFRSTSYRPKPGDLAFYKGEASKHGHIEIVASVSSSGVVKTIGGNTGWKRGTTWRTSTVSSAQKKSGLTGYIVINYKNNFTHKIDYNLNGGTGVTTRQSVKDGGAFTLHKAPTRPGYTFLGYYAKRKVDQTYHVQGVGWCKQEVIQNKKYNRKLYASGSKWTLDNSWTKGSPKSDYVFEAQWRLNEAKGSKTILNGRYHIVSALNNDYCLDVTGASKADGANVQLYTSRMDSKHTWNVTYLGGDGYYKITNYNSGKCLDVDKSGTQNGTNIKQWSHNGAKAQQWVIRANSDGSYSLISRCNGLYADVAGGKASNGTNIRMWQSNGSAAQKFYFVEWAGETIESGRYHIVSKLDSTKCLDVYGASTTAGANVQLYAATHDPKQTWNVTSMGTGFYKITNSNSGHSLDVYCSGKKNGTNVQQWTDNGCNAQRWVIRPNGDGSYNIISKCNGLSVDVYDGKTANETNIQMYVNNGTAAQKWVFVPYSPTEKPVKHDIEFDLNGGQGSFNKITVEKGNSFIVPTTIPTKSGSTFEGWYAFRKADQTWYVGGKGWFTSEQVEAQGFTRKLYSPGMNLEFSDSWLNGSPGSDHMFLAVWEDEMSYEIDEDDLQDNEPTEPEENEPAYGWTEWTEFSSAIPSEQDNRQIESKTEYRYRDKQFVTSGKDSLSGYTKESTKTDAPVYGAWSTGSKTGSTTVTDVRKSVITVESVTANKSLAHYCKCKKVCWRNKGGTCKYCGGKTNYGVISIISSKSLASSGFKRDSDDGSYYLPTTIRANNLGRLGTVYYMTWQGKYTDSFTTGSKVGGKNTYVWPAGTVKISRTKTVNSVNTFSKWGSWSNWSESTNASNNNRQVESRTLYRYRDYVQK